MKALLIDNYLIFVPVVAYVITQVLKMMLYSIMNRTFDIKRLIGSGGMPSSHSATVSALVTASIRTLGPGSPITAVALIFGIIVVYDAMGVRQQTGKHAKLLNKMIHNEATADDVIDQLNEMVGHTFLQVVVGVTLGIVVALCVPLR